MMTEDQLTALENRLAAAAPADLAAMAAEWLASVWPKDGQSPAFDPALAVSLDKALQLTVETFPNLAITLQGTAHPTIGQWTCTLRKSGLRNDYEMIGRQRPDSTLGDDNGLAARDDSSAHGQQLKSGPVFGRAQTKPN